MKLGTGWPLKKRHKFSSYRNFLNIGLAGLVLWILLMIKAYQGEKFKLPIAGDIAEKNVEK